MSHKTVVISGKSVVHPDTVPARVIADDALADCKGADRLYIKEGIDIDCLPGHVAWDCVKVPLSQSNDFLESEETWDFVTNCFFSGAEVQRPEFTFKKRDDECVRWLELKASEFQYICSLAFDLPREECELVGGRWLFTRSLNSGELLLRLASAFMEGREVEQDFSMALRCCEQACWCAVGDGIPFAAGEAFPGIEVSAVDQIGDREIYQDYIDLHERANRLKEEVLTHFQRIDIRMFEQVGEGNDIRYYRIPDHAFEGRKDMKDVLLPDELCGKHVHIGRRAFAECPNLHSISVRGVTDRFRLSRCADSFAGCNSLTDRIQYSADGKKVLFCLNAPEECFVCDHVRGIADFAFMHSRQLRDFKWFCFDADSERGVRTVGMRAFEGCNELCIACTEGCEIVLGSRAFADCQMLCEYRFGYDDRDEEIDVPVSFLDISSSGVFEGCENMLHIFPTVMRNRGFLVVHEGSAGAQFARCRELRDCPPIIAMRMPPLMFDSCNMLSEVKCIDARPDIIKAVVSGKRPAANLAEDVFSISTRAFAHCHSLQRFKFCRLRVSLRRGAESDVDLIDDNSKRVLFEREAFLDCNRLRRHESSFSGAMHSSDPSAFRGCPDFDDFVSE